MVLHGQLCGRVGRRRANQAGLRGNTTESFFFVCALQDDQERRLRFHVPRRRIDGPRRKAMAQNSLPRVASGASESKGLGWLARESDFLAVLDLPRTTDVRSHTLQVARLKGWIASGRSDRMRASVFVRGAKRLEIDVSESRDDVIESLAAWQPMQFVGGFDFYLDLPPGLTDPLEIELELTDGVASTRTPIIRICPDIDVGLLDTHVAHSPLVQEVARRMLVGRGLEFGALHLPLEVDTSKTQMSYADRHRKQDALELFGELRESHGAALVDVNHVVDLDRDDLSLLESHSFDFFVANGVIEHLVNPLRFLHHLHRIMKSGARLFLAAPDRDFTFDTRRALTPIEHLLEEYERDEKNLSDAHIEEALAAILPRRLPDDRAQRAELLDHHRMRSIHVHVWDQRSFDELVEVARSRLGIDLRILVRETSRRSGGNCLYVFEKA